MNKILAFVGFLAGINSVFGMDISENDISGQPEFECNNEKWSVICRNMSPENLKEHVAELDCAIDVTFENCNLSDGVDCTNASSLKFVNCKNIETLNDVFDYVGLYYHLWDATIIIDGKVIRD